MNREIKFRAWSEDLRTMLYQDKRTLGNFFDHVVYPYEHFKIMQYTGLNDKNGKEIYEGDIIQYDKRCFDFDKPFGEESWIEKRTDTVVFEYGQFKASQSSFGWEGEDLIDLDESEVVGNIYETPHLLNKEQGAEVSDTTKLNQGTTAK